MAKGATNSHKFIDGSFSFGLNKPDASCSGNGICKISSTIEPDSLLIALTRVDDTLVVEFVNVDEIQQIQPDIFKYFCEGNEVYKGYTPDEGWQPVDVSTDVGIMSLFPGFNSAIIGLPAKGTWFTEATFNGDKMTSLAITFDNIELT